LVPEEIEQIISYFENLNCNLIMYSTHNTLVFILAKYLSFINNINFDFELPSYLSNIRIEEWSDGIIKIYYNNWFLGNQISN
jgi:hypothetical protein